MEKMTLTIDKDEVLEEINEEQNITIPRSTVEMLEQTLQIA